MSPVSERKSLSALRFGEIRATVLSPLHQKQNIQRGYPCDDRAAILFREHEVGKVVPLNNESNAYFVCLENCPIKERQLKKEVLLSENYFLKEYFVV